MENYEKIITWTNTKWEYIAYCIDCLSKNVNHSLSHKTFFLRKLYPASRWCVSKLSLYFIQLWVLQKSRTVHFWKMFMSSLEEDGQGSSWVVGAPSWSWWPYCRVSSCSAGIACSSCCLQTLRSCRGAGRVLTQLRRHGQQRRQTPGLTSAPLTSADHALAVVSLQMVRVIYLYS